MGLALRELGPEREGEWSEGEPRAAGGAYLTSTTSPNRCSAARNRRAPGMNHLALRVSAPGRVDDSLAQAQRHGWRPLQQDRIRTREARITTRAGRRTLPRRSQKLSWPPREETAVSGRALAARV